MATKTKMRKEDLPAGEVLCSYCTAKCCRYFAFPIDEPKKREDFSYLRWFMLHGRVGVFIEDGVWYLMVYADCKHLREDNLCGIYEDRPDICRSYSTDNCEYEDDALYEKYFETPEQLWEYALSVMPSDKGHRFSTAEVSATTIALPVIG
ncbi:YkgJ family cysteine cluster protein [Planctomicrobium sp. SH668]|uniref:YkgJ family cysteine cluster protein n=1 Tax=Planctomicrobium sp. SH668 TaxID=3448126 RepID=UPI003F5C569B